MRAAPLIMCVMLATVLLSAGAASAAEGDIVIKGHVVDGSGDPLTGVNITAVYTSDSSYASSTWTNSDGIYELSLAAGTYNISATLEGFSANAVYHGINSDYDLDFTLSELPGTVTGRVIDGGSPVSGAKVVLEKDDKTESFNTTSDQSGEFSIEDVPPGTYLAHAEKDGYVTTFYYYLTVHRGEVTDVEITITMGTPSLLSGKVTYEGAPLEGVLVTLTSENGTKYTKTTDDEGGYVFQVPSGEYTITFSKAGYTTLSIKKILLPMREDTADVAMKKGALPGNTGFLADYDLPHSLMIVGLFMAVVTLVAALFLRFRVMARPDLLSRPGEDEE